MHKSTCAFIDCGRPVRTKNLCHAHYNQRSRGRALTPLKTRQTGAPVSRFWSNVRKTDKCWHWTGTLGDDGYGRLSVNNKYVLAHRFAYTLLVGSIPETLVIDHQCHNRDTTCVGGPCIHRRCVNPSHLEPTTRGDNVRRGHRWR